MVRYLTLPVRATVLAIVAAGFVLILLPAQVRSTIGLQAAAVTGWLLPAIALGTAVGWLTLSWTWFKRVTFSLCLGVVVVVGLTPTIRQALWEREANRVFEKSLQVLTADGLGTYRNEIKGGLVRSPLCFEKTHFSEEWAKCVLEISDDEVMLYDLLPARPKQSYF